ncbi:MAG: peptide chain release factor N(5)-glutamine methyltransferase [Spirochaetota bacterium]
MRLDDYIKDITGRLTDAGIESARLDCEVLVTHALNLEKYKLITDGSRELTSDEIKKIEKLVKRRITFEPVAYITGVKEFYSLDFIVNKHVLIPRPETELLVDMAIYWAGMNASVLDLCTGSGAVAVALKHSRRDLEIYASDISAEALKVARKNSLNINGKAGIKFYRGNLFEPFKGKSFDVIISNPPYVSSDEADSLKKDLFFEPEIALFAPENGRGIIEKIIVESVDYLNEKGTLLLEMGNNQGAFVTKLGEEKGYAVSILNDYSGLPRVATLKKND